VVAVRDRFARLDELRIHFRDWAGPTENAPVLVLLHGGLGDCRLWDPYVPALASRYRVVAPDARGHGESDWSGAHQYRTEHQVGDLYQLLGALGIEATALVGASMGGWTAYNLAARFPAMVTRLVIVDISPEVPAASSARLRAAGQQDRFASVEDAVAARLPLYRPGSEPVVRASVERNLVLTADGSFVWRYDAEGIRAGGIGSPDPEAQWRILGRIQAPTLLVRGQESDVLTAELVDRMCRTVPNISLVEVPHAGHPVPVEQPALFAAAMTPFLFAT
jgi:pimeloyl-ACP methyl ester carboxylesterase